MTTEARQGPEDPARRRTGEQLLHHGVADGGTDSGRAENGEPVPEPADDSAEAAVAHPAHGDNDRSNTD